jgi:peptidylprolyl isomerase
MKHAAALFLFFGTIAFAGAQSQPTTVSHTTSSSTAAAHSATAGSKLPPGIPPVHGILKTAFSLRYEDTKIGTGAVAEPNKLYKVQYTGYLAATGVKFDSSYDHRAPVLKDGKPVMGADGKPELGDPQPFAFPQGFGRLIPGFDQGFAGMRIGGKRRIFIPWQLAYGTRDIPARGADHPGIPAKSDLIFDVELVDVTDLPAQPGRPMPPHPGAGGAVGGHPAPGGDATHPAQAPAPTPAQGQPTAGKPATPPQPTAPAQPAAPPQPSTPAQPAAPATTPQPQSK